MTAIEITDGLRQVMLDMDRLITKIVSASQVSLDQRAVWAEQLQKDRVLLGLVDGAMQRASHDTPAW